jgi:hypothetical protein
LTLAAMTEAAVASNYRDAADLMYTAEAAAEFVLHEIASRDDWAELVDTPAQSSFVDGEPGGLRGSGAGAIDLGQATTDVTAAAAPPMDAVHGPSVLYAYGWFRDLVPAASRSSSYVAVWVADRSPASADEEGPPDVLSVVGRAYGVLGGSRGVEALVQKAEPSSIRLLAWRELP